MYDPDIHSVRSGNYHTLTLATPVALGGEGTTDYNDLLNKPTINGVEISGDLSLEDIGIPDLSDVPREVLTADDLDAVTPIDGDIIDEDGYPVRELNIDELDELTPSD